MSKFKVGDKVVRTKDCGKDEHFLSKLGQEIYYTVTSVIGDYWLQVDGWIDGADKHPWYASKFELYQEPEDKLPPVPRSVYYLKENGRRKLVAGINGDSVNVLISLRYRGEPEVLGYNMEPDAALQLAHDLRRMAMKIKREQK
ncbi:hypothetical protein [Klebsiella phage vB_KpnP_IME308]|jgi:hypothetical protein|uniref:Uncharacterized protein n=1 Tax=Klebsiella phage vB_KpnP_IME308 TaxID=2601648 RepID=A0A5J6CU82_9CAUD|nr:hypothetical protein [Klebsiella phage vB_KpnP_IME308]